ncbi:major facilitator superfamily domain-containing protein [Hypoxylon rubiginosum]|uniref:Major facilitator superfamily domain-containing protein n=1 Tax=Hypoxylon rubiginosum TaxID=110542 RepID=A0ACC0DF16_9PEZI|nr:major facilitator superfamily domain-containing protein [Hypoxylon rubiginosum]
MSLDPPAATPIVTVPKAESGERSPAESDALAAEPGFSSGPRFWLALAPILVLALMVSLDGTSVSVALPILANDLGGTSIQAFWVGTSFLLSSAVLQAPLGALSNIFGRMPVLLACTLLFLVGIILAAVAKEFTLMFVGRAIQGVGGGGVILLNDIIITDLVPMRQRGQYFGIVGGIWALGSIAGPVIGGALAYRASWRWIFWINVPVAAIALVLIPFFLRLSRPPGTIFPKLKRFDWFGSLFFVGASVCFLMPLTWGGVQYAWDDWRTLFPLILGVVAIVGFGILERYLIKEPIFNLGLLANYEMVYSLVATTVNAAIVYGALYFLPLYFEAVQGYDPILSGVALFPATFTVAPLSVVAGVIITKRGEYRWVTWIGWALSTLGLGVMILLDVGTSTAKWFFLTFTMGIGLGLLYTSLAIINQAAASDELITFAISMFIFSRMLGQCLGVAICGVTFQNQMQINLSNTQTLVDMAYEYSRDASGIIPLLRGMPDGLEKTELLQAYADSLQTVWAVMTGLSGAALIGSFFIKHISLDREHRTEQGIVRQEKPEETIMT